MSGEAAIRQRALATIVDVAPLSRWAKLAYYQLCTLMRITGTGLDNDDAYLRDVAAIRGWPKVKDELLRRGGFYVGEDGLFWNGRVHDELAAARATSLQRSGAAKSKNRKKGQPDGHQREILYPIASNGAGSGEDGFAGSAAAPRSPFGGSENDGFAGFPAPVDGIETARFAGSAAGHPDGAGGGESPAGGIVVGNGTAGFAGAPHVDSRARASSLSESSSSATTAESPPPPPADAAVVVVEKAFFEGLKEVYPGSSPAEVNAGKLRREVRGLLADYAELGADEVADVVQREMRRRGERGEAPPTVVRFCWKSVRAAAVAKRHEGALRPEPDADPPAPSTPEEKARKAARARFFTPLRQFFESGIWSAGLGPRPDDAGCAIPGWLIDEVRRRYGRHSEPPAAAVA